MNQGVGGGAQFFFYPLQTGHMMSPFQSQLTILQNAINNWHTLCNNFSDQHAETLSQTGVSFSYVLCYHCKICTLSETFLR